MRIGTTEAIIILVVVIIIFGPTQIPRLMKMLGNALKAFREGIGTNDKDTTVSDDTVTEKATAADNEKPVAGSGTKTSGVRKDQREESA